MQPFVRDVGCRHGIPWLYSQNVDSSALQYARREVPGTRRLRAITGIGIDLPARLFVGFLGAFDSCGLNSRQINHLQHIASETHYRGSGRQGKKTG
jgi:hypothetical protein